MPAFTGLPVAADARTPLVTAAPDTAELDNCVSEAAVAGDESNDDTEDGVIAIVVAALEALEALRLLFIDELDPDEMLALGVRPAAMPAVVTVDRLLPAGNDEGVVFVRG